MLASGSPFAASFSNKVKSGYSSNAIGMRMKDSSLKMMPQSNNRKGTTMNSVSIDSAVEIEKNKSGSKRNEGSPIKALENDKVL